VILLGLGTVSSSNWIIPAVSEVFVTSTSPESEKETPLMNRNAIGVGKSVALLTTTWKHSGGISLGGWI